MRSLALLALTPALVAQAPSAPSVDKLLAEHFEAQGGLAKLRALKSLKFQGRILQGPMEIALTGFRARGAFRTEVSVQGMTQITAFDGKAGWKIDPFQGYGGGKTAEALTPDEIKDAEEEADLDGPLVDYTAKGHKVEYMGQEPVEGSPAHILKVTLKNGQGKLMYLDVDSHLMVKQTSKRKIREREIETETYFSDYREVGGILFPFALEQGMKGMAQRGKIVVDKMELDAPVDPASLKMPAPAPAAAPAATPAPAGK